MDRNIFGRIGFMAVFCAVLSFSGAACSNDLAKTDSHDPQKIMDDFQFGVLKLGLKEKDFNSVFEDVDHFPSGKAGNCAVYDLAGNKLKDIYPWITTNIVELTFSPSPGGQDGLLTQISIGLSSSDEAQVLVKRYTRIFGLPKASAKNIQEWQLGNGIILRVSTYHDHSAVFISPNIEACIGG